MFKLIKDELEQVYNGTHSELAVGNDDNSKQSIIIDKLHSKVMDEVSSYGLHLYIIFCSVLRHNILCCDEEDCEFTEPLIQVHILAKNKNEAEKLCSNDFEDEIHILRSLSVASSELMFDIEDEIVEGKMEPRVLKKSHFANDKAIHEINRYYRNRSLECEYYLPIDTDEMKAIKQKGKEYRRRINAF